jgi:putative intracellular protease/amidase
MPVQIAIGLFPQFTALDAIGPYQVFTNLPGADVVVCAAHTGIVSDDENLLHFDVQHTFADVPAPDVLVVPGGVITRRLARDGDPVIDWIRAAHPHTTYTASVCTGSLLLGAAGLLDGLTATTHWASYEVLRSLGAEPTEKRVVEAGKIFTAAGVSSGIDLALTLVARLTGPEVAQAIQLGIEYDPQPPFDAGAPSKAPADIVDLVRSMLAEAENQILSQP